MDGLHTTDVGNSLGFGKVASDGSVQLDKLDTESPIFKKIYEAVPAPTDAALLKDLGELPSDAQELERVRENVRMANAKMKAFSYFNREARYTSEVMVNGPIEPSRIELYQKLPAGPRAASDSNKVGAVKSVKGAEKIGAWKQIGTQLGSNAGGMFKDPAGTQWYVKTTPTPDHAKNELLANKLYAAAGIRVPEAKLIVRDGQVGVASRFIEGLKPVPAHELTTLNGVAEGFASDAWLANWDVVGANGGNLLKQGDTAVRVDTGGALLYRARGDGKGAKFDPKAVPELNTLRDSRINADAAPVFSGLANEQVATSIDNVLKVKDKTIKTLCKTCGPGTREQRKQLAKDLINRKNTLGEYAQTLREHAEKDTAPSAADKTTSGNH